MINLSTGFVNALADSMGLKEILTNMIIEFRTGAQPANADAADSGTLLWKASVGAGALTAETLATATVPLVGASANVTTFTVGGHTLFSVASLPVFSTAAALATSVVAAINASPFNLGFTASVTGGTSVLLTAPKNTGAFINTVPVVCSAAGIDGGDGTVNTTFSGGVTALNHLSCPDPVDGVITYDPNVEVWSGYGLASGLVQHFRIKCSGAADVGAASTTNMRIDGSVAQIGGDMRVTVAEVTVGKLQTVDSFTVTLPK